MSTGKITAGRNPGSSPPAGKRQSPSANKAPTLPPGNQTGSLRKALVSTAPLTEPSPSLIDALSSTSVGGETRRLLSSDSLFRGRDRDNALLAEHRVQFLLNAIVSPLVASGFDGAAALSRDFAETLDNYAARAAAYFTRDTSPTMIGVHYRGDIAIAGRRSLFPTNPQKICARAKALGLKDDRLSPPNLDHDFVADVNELLLQLYFLLFGKESTVNEWVIDQFGAEARVQKEHQEAPFIMSFDIGDMCDVSSTSYKQPPSTWIRITIPETLADILMPPETVRTLLSLVLELLPRQAPSFRKGGVSAIAAALNPHASSDARRDANDTERHMLLEYLRQMREFREKASSDDRFRRMTDRLRHRRRAAVGVVLQDYPRLLQLASYSDVARQMTSQRPWETYDNDAVPHRVDRAVGVLQAVLLYIRFAGGAFLTAPVYPPGKPGCCVTLLGVTDIQNRAVPLHECFRFLTTTMGSVATRAAYEATPLKPTSGEPFASAATIVEGLRSPQLPSRGSISRDVDPPPVALVAQFLSVLQDTCGFRHEGHPVALTFILGRSIDLMHDSEVVHEFLNDNTRMRFVAAAAQEASHTEDWKRALALIKGNFAFMQDADAALFLARPTDVLEITHLARIRRHGGEASRGNRRRLVEEWTASPAHHGAIVGISYGTGCAEVISRGRVVATYRQGHRWNRSEGFRKFWEDVCTRGLSRIVGSERDLSEVRWERLCAVVERVSGEVGAGTLIVIAKKPSLDRLRTDGTHLTEVFDLAEGRAIEKLDAEVLYQAAIQDGALLIDAESGKLSARWQIRSVNPATAAVALGKGKGRLQDAWRSADDVACKGDGFLKHPFKWENSNDWLKTLEWGTRHMAAISATLRPVQTARGRAGAHFLLTGANVVSIVVSADGPVWVFHQGRAIAKFQ